MKKVDISHLFHWLYGILMLLPFIGLIFNLVRFGFSGTQEITSTLDLINLIYVPVFGGLSNTIYGVFNYCVSTMFGLSGVLAVKITSLMSYWLCISLIWLVFDVVMYVPNLVHRWLDKGAIK